MDFTYTNVFAHPLANKSRRMKMVQVRYLPSSYPKSKIDTIYLFTWSNYSVKTFTSYGKSKNYFEIIQFQAKFQTPMVSCTIFIMDHKFQ